ncbi:hypothetical protein PYCC9005_004314 [Savitreella phatthalungensis]
MKVEPYYSDATSGNGSVGSYDSNSSNTSPTNHTVMPVSSRSNGVGMSQTSKAAKPQQIPIAPAGGGLIHQGQQGVRMDMNMAGIGGVHNNGSAKKKLASGKRADQNRKAQRAFRQRKDKYIKDLELRSQELDIANSLIIQLKEENDRLNEIAKSFHQRITELETQLAEVYDEGGVVPSSSAARQNSVLRGAAAASESAILDDDDPRLSPEVLAGLSQSPPASFYTGHNTNGPGQHGRGSNATLDLSAAGIL